jgi:hypothetical protein
MSKFGECEKHEGHPMMTCPLCAMEYKKTKDTVTLDEVMEDLDKSNIYKPYISILQNIKPILSKYFPRQRQTDKIQIKSEVIITALPGDVFESFVPEALIFIKKHFIGKCLLSFNGWYYIYNERLFNSTVIENIKTSYCKYMNRVTNEQAIAEIPSEGTVTFDEVMDELSDINGNFNYDNIKKVLSKYFSRTDKIQLTENQAMIFLRPIGANNSACIDELKKAGFIIDDKCEDKICFCGKKDCIDHDYINPKEQEKKDTIKEIAKIDVWISSGNKRVEELIQDKINEIIEAVNEIRREHVSL